MCSSDLKIDDLVDRSDKFVLQIGKDMLGHIQANTIRERVVQIVGLQGTYWVNALPKDIKAQTDVAMESVAAPKTNPETDKQQAIQFLNIATQIQQMLIQQGSPEQIDLVQLTKWLFEKFGYRDTGRFFRPALIPLTPLQENMGESSNNLNGGGLPPLQGRTPGQPMSPSDLQAQFGQGAIVNASNVYT